MKTIFKIPVSVFLLVFTKEGKGQTATDSLREHNLTYMDASLTGLHSSAANGAIGFGINAFSKAVNSPNKQTPPLELRFGGGFYVSGLMSKSIDDVPLEAPQTGSATVIVRNTAAGFNALARVSGSYSHRVIPYVDLFAGVLDISCNMVVDPHSERYSSTSQAMSEVSNYSYGFSAGIMISACKPLKFRLGLSSIYTSGAEK